MRRGFTLMEILLALAVLVLLVGAVSIGTQSTQKAQRLKDASDLWETAFRMARAEAALRGRQVRLSFVESQEEESTATTPVFEIELDPLDAPNEFTTLSDTWTDHLDVTGVYVSQCYLDNTPAEDDDLTQQKVRFYPDGSSDTASIHLRHDNPDDQRMAIVSVHGLTGAVTTEMTRADLWEEEQSEQEEDAP